jgi:hypothetical protein
MTWADLDLGTVVSETVGRVHRGFKREVYDLWPRLEQALVNNTRTLWFAGHSLGGAMAAICAGRCVLSHIRSNPRALFTYGAPRVGNRRYVNYVEFEAYRWVNNNDIVPRLPPAWLGFRHKGQEIYLNAYGEIRRLTHWQRVKDRWRGLIRGLREGNLDFFRPLDPAHRHFAGGGRRGRPARAIAIRVAVIDSNPAPRRLRSESARRRPPDNFGARRELDFSCQKSLILAPAARISIGKASTVCNWRSNIERILVRRTVGKEKEAKKRRHSTFQGAKAKKRGHSTFQTK